MTKYTDNLWQDLVREHGPTLAQADRPEPAHVRRPRPRVLAGGTLGLAGVGAAIALALSTSATSPAFAVTPHHDGSVSVKIYRKSGIVGANHKLAALGIHEKLYAVASQRSISVGKKTVTSVSISGTAWKSLPQSCLRDQKTGGVVHVAFPSVAAQQRSIVNGTYVPPSNAGNTGGVPNNGPWVVVACPVDDSGNSGNSGNTGAS